VLYTTDEGSDMSEKENSLEEDKLPEELSPIGKSDYEEAGERNWWDSNRSDSG
jgi:hypothetical protein